MCVGLLPSYIYIYIYIYAYTYIYTYIHTYTCIRVGRAPTLLSSQAVDGTSPAHFAAAYGHDPVLSLLGDRYTRPDYICVLMCADIKGLIQKLHVDVIYSKSESARQ